jgi:hypothetical protein
MGGCNRETRGHCIPVGEASVIAKRRRRWYQFCLRTFFVLVTLVCVGFGYWVHWSREWIRRRHEWLYVQVYNKPTGRWVPSVRDPPTRPPPPRAPGGLWLFGEEGAGEIDCPSEEQERAQQLFPEAIVYPVSQPTFSPPPSR